MVQRPHILIVDDDILNAELLQSYININHDYQVDILTSGQACIDLIAKGKRPDLVFLDIVMPKVNGYQVCQALAKEDSTAQIPVIFITGEANEASETKALSLGAVDYIPKPFSLAVINARLKNHLKIKQQRDKLIEIAYKDQLTGLNNRHYFSKEIMRTIEKIKNNKKRKKLYFFLIDIDDFKKFNDQYGHSAGDTALSQFAQTLFETSQQNPDSFVVRWGGEEFLMVWPEQCGQQALIKAQQLLGNIAQNRSHLTASIGISQLQTDDNGDYHAALERADRGLYNAKMNGKNCVISKLPITPTNKI